MSTTDKDAARVAILSLYATIADRANIDATRMRIGADSNPLSWEQAAIRLSEMKKPIQCSAVVEERLLNVICGDLLDAWRAIYEYRREDSIQLPAMLRSLGDGSENVTVLVRAGPLSMVTTPEVVAAWMRSYLITGPLSMATRGRHDKTEGGQVVIEFSASEKLDLDSELGQQFRVMLQRPDIK